MTKLLRLARYDAQEPAPSPQPVDLVQLAFDTVARLSPLADSRRIDLGTTRQGGATEQRHVRGIRQNLKRDYASTTFYPTQAPSWPYCQIGSKTIPPRTQD